MGGILGLANFAAFAFQPDRDDLGNFLEFDNGEGNVLPADTAESFGLSPLTSGIDTVTGVLDPSTGALLEPTTGTLGAGGFGIPRDINNFGPFRLTQRDGTQYRFDVRTGRLEDVTDPQGNTLTFGPDIVSTNAAGPEKGATPFY